MLQGVRDGRPKILTKPKTMLEKQGGDDARASAATARIPTAFHPGHRVECLGGAEGSGVLVRQRLVLR
ncbi:MAG TPA: hypothetical protein VJT49_34745 [Amycolatopsis sp.]|uniref:hypothetical protein n=1 Tax=Amycolatopsis sp. TaxID=37632 RepID=UPI002B486B47|nr:hypothetical protein [Amycolatopsis sp.]HKS50180.1 hypothetical protein [Amycolatopsis sp.]